VQRSAERVIGVSRMVADNVLAGNPTAKTEVLYNGIDPLIFFDSRSKLMGGLPRVISVGNLIPLKDHKTLLQALALFRDKHGISLKCEILGRGPLLKELKSLCHALSLEDSVSFPGYLSPQETAERMNKADVFVLPSYYEALGCVYLEAMSCGLAVIACRNQGIGEIIEDGVTGCLIPRSSPSTLALVLEDIVDNTAKWKKIALNGKSVASYFTWDHAAGKLSSIISDIIPGGMK
jgi:glycosyltransferase involved in cell wall biosynthesis